MPVRLALVQLDVSDAEKPPERVDRALDLLAGVAADADLVVLPELWHVGAFDTDAAREHAQPLDGDLVARLRAAAARAGTWVHGGSFSEAAADGRFFNTSVLIAPDGALAATYRKIHLFGFEGGETTLMSAGSELVVRDTPCGATGLATCYDLRFPELFRGLVDAGASAFLLASGWPLRRIGHWSLLTRARALEDQAWVVACNSAGSHAGVPMGGRSVVVDPQGDVVAEAGAGEEVLQVEIDPQAPSRWREAFPVLADRRL